MLFIEWKLPWSQFHSNMFPGAQVVLASICSDNGLAPRRQQVIIGINYTLIYWHIYAFLDHNAWVPAGCQTISWTNADPPPPRIYNNNGHELGPNLCILIEHYDINKPVCGLWIYPLQIECKQTLFYVPWTVKDRTHAVRVTSIKKWLC